MNRAQAIVSAAFVVACGDTRTKQRAPAAAPLPARAQVIEATVERAIPPIVQVRGEETYSTLEERMRAIGVPAVSIAVFEDYEIVWAKAYGVANAQGRRVDTDTLFQAASISKPVNALAILLAAADGALSLEEPVNSQLTSWQLPDNALTKTTPVTLEMLLTHTAGTTVHGFRGYTAAETTPTTLEILDGSGPANSAPVRVDIPPGSAFRYSGGGITISQLALVDNVSGSYSEILQRSVLDPFGMTRSTFAQPLPAEKLENAAAGYLRNGDLVETERHVYPELAAAGLWTTPSDLARFLIVIASARTGRSSPIAGAIANAITTPAVEQDRPDSAVAVGTFLDKRGVEWMFGHGGANEGFRAIATASRDRGYGFVIMTNSDNGMELASEIERALFGLDGWLGSELVERVALDPARAATIAGRYVTRDSAIPFAVSAEGQTLTIARPFSEPTELVATASEFVSRADGLRFEPRVEGRALRIRGRNGAPDRIATRLADDATSPLLLLATGDNAGALARWREIARSEPKSVVLNEAELNAFGYELLGRKRVQSALVLFRFVASAVPSSSNAHDSLGEALALQGDIDEAIAAYETALAKLDSDASIPSGEKPARRAHGEAQLAKLRARD